MKKWQMDNRSKDLLKIGLILITYVFVLLNLSKITGVLNGSIKVIMPFILGFAIAYVLNPMIGYIEKFWTKLFKHKLNHKIAMGISYFILIGFVALVLILVLPAIITSITNIGNQLPDAIKGFYGWVEKDFLGKLSQMTNGTVSVDKVYPILSERISGFMTYIGENVSKIISITMSVASFILNFALGVLISIYMLSRKDVYKAGCKKILFALFSDATVKDILEFANQIHNIFSKFLVAKIIDSIIIGVLCYVGCLILRLDNAVIIAVIVGVTNVIPYFGPFIGAIPCAVIALLQGINPMIIFVIFILALQQFDGNILGPKLLGNSLGLGSLWIIFAVIVMIAIFGVVGMFIGVPLFAVIFMIVKGYIHVKLEEKNKSTKTEDYMD